MTRERWSNNESPLVPQYWRSKRLFCKSFLSDGKPSPLDAICSVRKSRLSFSSVFTHFLLTSISWTTFSNEIKISACDFGKGQIRPPKVFTFSSNRRKGQTMKCFFDDCFALSVLRVTTKENRKINQWIGERPSKDRPNENQSTKLLSLSFLFCCETVSSSW